MSGIDREAEYAENAKASQKRVADLMERLGGVLEAQNSCEYRYVFKHTMLMFDIDGPAVRISALVYDGAIEQGPISRSTKLLCFEYITNSYTGQALESVVAKIKGIDSWIEHHFKAGDVMKAYFANIVIPCLDKMYRLVGLGVPRPMMLPVFESILVTKTTGGSQNLRSFEPDSLGLSISAHMTLSGDMETGKGKFNFEYHGYGVRYTNTDMDAIRVAFHSVVGHVLNIVTKEDME